MTTPKTKKKKMRSRLTVSLGEKCAFNMNEAAAYGPLGRSRLYEEIKAGNLRSARVGGRRAILRFDLEEFYRARTSAQ